MRKLLDPRWLFVVNTLPVVLLFIIGWGEFDIIKTLLNRDSILFWKQCTIFLLALSISTFGYALIKTIRKEKVDTLFAILSLVVYTVYVYVFYNNASELIPWSVPRWMVSGNLQMYGGTFLMPTIVYSIFILVIKFTPKVEETKTWTNFVAAISVPIVFYVFGILLSPLWRSVNIGSEHFFMLFVVIVCVVFFFFLIRFFYVMSSKKTLATEYQILWRMLIAFVFPFIGLALNEGMDNMFGDFSGAEFYILAFIAAIFICLPEELGGKIYRLVLFLGRCAVVLYTLYFFLVFMPLLPFAVFAIILIGTGFLMLTPLALFILHINLITKDYAYLKQYYKAPMLACCGFIGLLLVPAALTLSYLKDKKNLNEALEYVYSPDYDKEYNISDRSILHTLSVIREQDKRNSNFYNSTPFLSGYYKWLVMDNLTLSASKEKMMSEVFEGNRIYADLPYYNIDSRTNTFNTDTAEIKITDIQHRSRYDVSQGYWISQIDFSITNYGRQLRNSEYYTQFELPDGCWISNYYLYVEGVKEMGILAEKKAATWVFNQIRNVNLDPGLLRYEGGNKIGFKVFPFNLDETRYTGIEFIHKSPVKLQIDSNEILLGEKLIDDIGASIGEGCYTKTGENNSQLSYISGEWKKQLDTVVRKPYYHFIVDVSRSAESESEKNIASINHLLDKKLIDVSSARISFVGNSVHTQKMRVGWENDLKNTEFKGGFYADRAIRKILRDSYLAGEDSYPVIILVADNINKSIFIGDYSDLEFTYPDNPYLYYLNDKELQAYDLTTLSYKGVVDFTDIIETKNVKKYSFDNEYSVYLPDNDLPSIAINQKDKFFRSLDNTDQTKWSRGLVQQAEWISQVLNPDITDEEWLSMIRSSFETGIMTPLTSYIVVENEAQKAILKKKQEEVLSGNRNLDLTDDSVRMSEPDLYILLLILLVFLVYRRSGKKLKSKM